LLHKGLCFRIFSCSLISVCCSLFFTFLITEIAKGEKGENSNVRRTFSGRWSRDQKELQVTE